MNKEASHCTGDWRMYLEKWVLQHVLFLKRKTRLCSCRSWAGDVLHWGRLIARIRFYGLQTRVLRYHNILFWGYCKKIYHICFETRVFGRWCRISAMRVRVWTNEMSIFHITCLICFSRWLDGFHLQVHLRGRQMHLTLALSSTARGRADAACTSKDGAKCKMKQAPAFVALLSISASSLWWPWNGEAPIGIAATDT